METLTSPNFPVLLSVSRFFIWGLPQPNIDPISNKILKIETVIDTCMLYTKNLINSWSSIPGINYILGVVLYMAKATKYIDTLFNNVEKKIKGVQMVVTYRCVPIMHLEGNFKSDLSCQDLMMSLRHQHLVLVKLSEDFFFTIAFKPLAKKNPSDIFYQIITIHMPHQLRLSQNS